MSQLVIKDIVDRITSEVNLDRNMLESTLIKYDKVINNMSDVSKTKLINYIIKDATPPKNIGMYYAQQLLHGITQSSLSGKTTAHTEYISIMDVLEMSSTNSMCFVDEPYYKVLELEEVRLRDLIISIEHRDNRSDWVNVLDRSPLHMISDYDIIRGGTYIVLNKVIMSKYAITMSNIRSSIYNTSQYSREILVSPNMIAELYIDDYYRSSVLNIISAIDYVIVSGVRDIKFIDSYDGKYRCHSRHYKALRERGVNVTCNDIGITFTEHGIVKCRDLIIRSLIANDGISLQCALTVCIYMTYNNKPLPFNKSSIKGLYGPMFDMYYSTPVETIVNWIISNEKDSCVSLYTRLMVGNKSIE